MTIYAITAWCEFPHYATFTVEAASVQDALAKARQEVAGEVAEPCDGGSTEWNEFEISSEETDEYLRHLESDRAAEIAGPQLLNALHLGVAVASEVIARWEQGDPAHAVRGLAFWLAAAEKPSKKPAKPKENPHDHQQNRLQRPSLPRNAPLFSGHCSRLP